MISDDVFKKGRQPCPNFRAGEESAFGGKPHCCQRCGEPVWFCKNCTRDHHFGGYETCNERLGDIEAAQERTRAGLEDVRERLRAVRTSAMMGHLPGVSRWIFETICEVNGIFSWFGTPIALSNSNSNSKEDRSSRITNSSSKNRDKESTNTKYEEQAP